MKASLTQECINGSQKWLQEWQSKKKLSGLWSLTSGSLWEPNESTSEDGYLVSTDVSAALLGKGKRQVVPRICQKKKKNS